VSSLNKYQLAAAIAVGILGALTVWTVPGFVALVARHANLDVHQMGYVASVDINSMAVAVGVTTFLLPILRWRSLAWAGIGLIALGNLGSASAHEFGSLAFVRVIVGAGEGVCVGVSFASFGLAAVPARAFAVYMISGASVSASLLAILPGLQSAVGTSGVFYLTAALASLVAIAAAWFPNEERVGMAGTPQASATIDWPLACKSLVAVCLYFFAQGAVWSYFGRIAELNQIPAAAITRALAAGTMAGIAGASLAGALANRVRPGWPMVCSGVVSVAAFVLLLRHLDGMLLLLSAVLIVASWNFAQPLLSGVCCAADARGRIACAMGCVQTVGFGLGPAAAGMLINGQSFAPIIWMSTGALFAGVAVLLTGLRVPRGV
jgi:predicted MFS family arabinose efflux permease